MKGTLNKVTAVVLVLVYYTIHYPSLGTLLMHFSNSLFPFRKKKKEKEEKKTHYYQHYQSYQPIIMMTNAGMPIQKMTKTPVPRRTCDHPTG